MICDVGEVWMQVCKEMCEGNDFWVIYLFSELSQDDGKITLIILCFFLL